ncbi:MAG: hypothetical protein WCV90_08915 [Candidatus Woesearchaeota archaeon]|jgi:hypothetical protein
MVKIQLLNKRELVQVVNVGRKNLTKYLKYSKDPQGRVVWVREETLNLLKKKISRYKGYKEEKGRTETMKKKFVRFRFALWRYSIEDQDRLDALFVKLKDKYKKVRKLGKKFPAQRVGLTIAAQEKEYDSFTSSKTKRTSIKEIYDFISTSTYANNDPSTDGMFEELYDKVLNYLNKKGRSPSLLDDDVTKTAKHFYVFFMEE